MRPNASAFTGPTGVVAVRAAVGRSPERRRAAASKSGNDREHRQIALDATEQRGRADGVACIERELRGSQPQRAGLGCRTERVRAFVERGRGIAELARARGCEHEPRGAPRIVDAERRLHDGRVATAGLVCAGQSRAAKRERSRRPRRRLRSLRAREHLAEDLVIAEPRRERDRRGMRGRRRCVPSFEHAIPRAERGRGRALQLVGVLWLRGGRGPDGFFPRQRAAQLCDLGVELLAGCARELVEQLRAIAPPPRGGERFSKRFGQRERLRMVGVALLEQLDRGVELTLRDHAERGAQPGSFAIVVAGHREIDVDRELRGLGCNICRA